MEMASLPRDISVSNDFAEYSWGFSADGGCTISEQQLSAQVKADVLLDFVRIISQRTRGLESGFRKYVSSNDWECLRAINNVL